MAEVTEDIRLGRRYRLQVILAWVSAMLIVLAVVVPTWIERLTGLEPDGGSGEMEWLLAVVPCVSSIAFGVLAHRTRRRLLTAQANSPPI